MAQLRVAPHDLIVADSFTKLPRPGSPCPIDAWSKKSQLHSRHEVTGSASAFAQSRILRVRLLEDSQVSVGVLPELQEFSIFGEALLSISSLCVCAGETEVGQRPIAICRYHATVVDNLLELGCSLVSRLQFQISQAAIVESEATGSSTEIIGDGMLELLHSGCGVFSI